MSLASAIASMTGSHEEVLAEVKELTVTAPGVMPGADLQAILISKGLMKTVRNAATDPNDTSFFADICIGLEDRFKPDGQINFARQDAQNLLGAFAYSTAISAKLAAVNSSPIDLYTEVLTAATEVMPMFPGVTLRDIIAIREPNLAQPAISNEIDIPDATALFALSLNQDLPESCAAKAEVTYGDGIWREIGVVNLDHVRYMGTYYFGFTARPAPVVTLTSKLRITLPYNVSFLITAGG